MATLRPKAFARALTERYADFKEAIDKVVIAFGNGADAASRKGLLATAASRADSLLALLANEDRPEWLKSIYNSTNACSGGDRDSMCQALRVILNIHHQVQPIRLDFEDDTKYSFDNLFERLRDEHHVSDIFDRLASELIKIIESNEVDSTAVLGALSQMVAVLKANRSGSFSSVFATFSYARFAWNFVKEALKRIPGVQEAVVAAEKTIEEGEAKIEAIRAGLRDESHAALLQHVPNLTRISQ